MDSLLTNFMKMGYPQDKVRRALELAGNDFATTLDYLVNGLPPPSMHMQAQPNKLMQAKNTNHINNININTNNNNESDIDDLDDIYGYSDDDNKNNNNNSNTNIQKTIINSTCKCGAKLLKKTTSDAFIYCDGCNELMQRGDIIYTCSKGTEPLQHRSGYDLCSQCAKQNKSAPTPKNTCTRIPPSPPPSHTNNNTQLAIKCIKPSQNNYNTANTQNVYNPLAQMMNMAPNMNFNTLQTCTSTPAQNGYNNDIYYEWEWSSHGGSRWNKYNSQINDILNNKLVVGKTMQIQIRGNIYNITKYDQATAIQKNPQTNKIRKVRRVELNQTYENDSNKHESGIQRIIEILGCNYEEAQYAYKCSNNNEEVAINYLLENNWNSKDVVGVNNNNKQSVMSVMQDNNININMQQNNSNINDDNGVESVDSDIDEIYGYSNSEDEKKGNDETLPNAQTAAAQAAMGRYNEAKNKEINFNGNGDKLNLKGLDNAEMWNDDKNSMPVITQIVMPVMQDNNMQQNSNNVNIFDVDNDLNDVYGYSDDEKKVENKDGNDEAKNKKMNNKNVDIDIDDIYGYSDDEINDLGNVELVKTKGKDKVEMCDDDNEEIIYFNDGGKDKNVGMGNCGDDESDMDDIYGYSDDEKASQTTDP